jgi:alkanesulfonate monooxygenase SsuD/methylene tetrahydromethanopterin reductase-like flavin-dependent oxidoreductase (luciferase family)
MTRRLVGVGLWGMQSTRFYPREHPALYREMVEEIVLAEQMGFDFALFTEHHFAPDGSCPSILLTAAAAAQATSRIGVGTGLLLPPLHDREKLVDQVMAVDGLLGSRLILGVGLGYREIEFVARAQPRHRRVQGLEERIEALREAARARPRPGLEIWLGGHVEATARRAARLGCGLMMPSYPSYEQLAELFRLRGAMSATDTPWGSPWGALRAVWVAPTDDEARAYMFPRLRYLFEEQYGGWGMFTDIARGAQSAQEAESGERALQSERYAIAGSPDTVTRGLQATFEAGGAQYVVCRINTGTQSHDEMMKCLRLLGEHVLPRLREGS